MITIQQFACTITLEIKLQSHYFTFAVCNQISLTVQHTQIEVYILSTEVKQKLFSVTTLERKSIKIVYSS